MPSVVPTMPLTRKAVTFAFCHTARSSRRTTATFVSKSTRDRLCRDLIGRLELAEQQVHDFADLFFEVRIRQPPLVVEARLCMPDRDFALDHAGAGRAQHLAELSLGPYGAEHPGARTDDRDVLVPKRVRREWARYPVDGVLERPWNRGVVLGGREEDGVGLGDRRAKSRDGLRTVLYVIVLVVRRDVTQPVVDLELRALGFEQLAGMAHKRAVVRVAAQGAADTEKAHRTSSPLRSRCGSSRGGIRRRAPDGTAASRARRVPAPRR